MAFIRAIGEKLNIDGDGFVIGLDLKNDNSQISYYAFGSDMPETVSMTVGAEDYDIPTVLCRRFEVNQWYFGRQAVTKAAQKDGVLVADLVKRAAEGAVVPIEGEDYYAVDLLALFVKRCFTRLPASVSKDRIRAVMITVEKLDQGMVDALLRVSEVLGIDKEKVFFNACAESFYGYMVHQDRELWEQETLLLDLTPDGLHAYRMKLNHQTKPMVIMVEEKIYPDFQVYREDDASVLKGGRIEVNKSPAVLDREFLTIARELCEGHVVSSVYIIGRGFSQNWSKESLNYICRNRRVFQGNNLFSKGAAYAAMERLRPGDKNSEYVYIGGDKLRANLGMHVYRKGSEAYMALLDAGVNWYETSREADLFLENGTTLTLIITLLNGGRVIKQDITLEDYPLRNGKTNRIRMHVEPVSVETVRITVTDLGFGEIFPSSGKTWVKEIRICE